MLDSSLRRKQIAVAMAGNVTMLIWLGKQHLAQQDRVAIDTEEGASTSTGSATPPTPPRTRATKAGVSAAHEALPPDRRAFGEQAREVAPPDAGAAGQEEPRRVLCPYELVQRGERRQAGPERLEAQAGVSGAGGRLKAPRLLRAYLVGTV